MGPRLLIVETSGRAGFVAGAEGEKLLEVRRLDETRRHARDLAPAAAAVLSAAGWAPGAVDAVIVSRGPGSYTGLRVGVMAAKAFAYVTGCAVLAIDTFAAIADQAPAEALQLDVLADAQQDKVYVQRFARPGPEQAMAAASELTIRPFSEWQAGWEPAVWVSGPGLRGLRARLSEGCGVVDAALWEPQLESLLQLGLARFRRGERDDVYALEPLYLRPSSAEEKWQTRGE
jgi:tRNA threonylcarbamoyladenosine biosynthesis protein TsaB